MNGCQPPNCPCFCPTAELPIAPIVVAQGGPAGVITIPIFGTQPFQVAIVTNPMLPVTGVPLIASAQLFNGNVLTITTAVPALTETIAPYVATLQVCNACGTVEIQIQVDVAADITPILESCVLAQQLWTAEAREPALGDTLLAFTPAGCRALLPPTIPDVCTEIQAFPGVVPTLVTQLATADCGLATVLDVLALYDLCAALNTFPAGAPPVVGDRLITLQGASCVTTTVQELADVVEANIDVCVLLQNLPNAVVQPTAVFYGQQAGQCFEFAVSDLSAALTGPFLVGNGSCAAPSYSFSAFPQSGMFYDPAGDGAVIIGDENCEDFISVGASVIAQSKASGGNAGATVTLASATASFGGIITIKGGDATVGTGAGAIFIQAGHNNGAIAPANVEISGGNSSTPAGGNITIKGGFGAVEQGLVQLGGAGNLFSINNLGYDWQGGTAAWRINLDPGVAGQVITSSGPGLAPTWQAAGGAAFPMLAPSGACAAPSYSFTASPDSGMFYTGTAVRIGDDNCADYMEIGGGFGLTPVAIEIKARNASPPGNIIVTAGNHTAGGSAAKVAIVGGNSGANFGAAVQIFGADPAGGGSVQALAGSGAGGEQGSGVIAFGGAAGLGGDAQMAGGFFAGGIGAAITVKGSQGGAHGDIEFRTANTLHFAITGLAEWELAGNPGVAGQRLTSQGPGLPPIWAP